MPTYASYVVTVTLMQSMKKLDNEALHCVCNCSIEYVENLWEATAHLTQFPPAKFPVNPPANQADGVGGGPPPGYDSTGLLAANSWFIYVQVLYRVDRVRRTGLTVSRGEDSSPQSSLLLGFLIYQKSSLLCW